MVITQTQDELLLHTEDAGLPVPDECQRYGLDGGERVCLDTSLGELQNFIRKVETKAVWDGQKLTLVTTPFSEVAEVQGVIHRNDGVTAVLTIELQSDGRQLSVERTGFRSAPPPMLHGCPYKADDDLVYRRDVTTYMRTVGQP